MKVEVSVPFQSSLSLENGLIHIVGAKSLLLKVNELQKKYGSAIRQWPLTSPAVAQDDLLINEFIRKAKNEPFVYSQDELCHCRMVRTETVKNAVKAGCRTQPDVSRVTLAGTGCGSCRGDIEDVIKALTA